jgi:hypothetical protein
MGRGAFAVDGVLPGFIVKRAVGVDVLNGLEWGLRRGRK